METKLSLKSLFESNQEQLAEKLSQFVLPQDAVKVQNAVKTYLNELFDSNGDFRQNLTQSEDYILQAAMSLLNAQQAMVSEFATPSFSEVKNDNNKVESKLSPQPSVGLNKDLYPHAIGATALGGAVGGFVLGTWGAVFGSIAGTALILYYATQQGQQAQGKQKTSQVAKPAEIPTQKIDVQKFVNIISNICDSIDTLMDTFRVQISRVVDKYENQEKPVLEKEYGVLVDSIQSLLGAAFQSNDDKRQKRIDNRIEQLAESLENYDLEVVVYNEDSKQYFEISNSDKVDQPIMVLPAIIKKGEVVRKGKVMVNG